MHATSSAGADPPDSKMKENKQIPMKIILIFMTSILLVISHRRTQTHTDKQLPAAQAVKLEAVNANGLRIHNEIPSASLTKGEAIFPPFLRKKSEGIFKELFYFSFDLSAFSLELNCPCGSVWVCG